MAKQYRENCQCVDRDLTPWHEIGRAMGKSGEWGRWFGQRTIRKLRRRLEAAGIDAGDFAGIVAVMREEQGQ